MCGRQDGWQTRVDEEEGTPGRLCMFSFWDLWDDDRKTGRAMNGESLQGVLPPGSVIAGRMREISMRGVGSLSKWVKWNVVVLRSDVASEEEWQRIWKRMAKRLNMCRPGLGTQIMVAEAGDEWGALQAWEEETEREQVMAGSKTDLFQVGGTSSFDELRAQL